VKSRTAWKEIQMFCRGCGTVEILMNGKTAGRVKISGSEKPVNCTGELHMPAGEYEVTLRAVETEQLEIMEIKLF
ncbi:MAG: hypothetical protein K2G19_05860, partial [Lachnospiraceae bacterium]|nr:hypothetical protein [Lachnospiraceae bacterium]